MVVTPDYVVEVEEKRFYHPPGTNIANVGTGTCYPARSMVFRDEFSDRRDLSPPARTTDEFCDKVKLSEAFNLRTPIPHRNTSAKLEVHRDE